MRISRIDKIIRRTLLLAACFVLAGGASSLADTHLLNGGDPLAEGGWTNGLPTAANPGFVNSGVTGTFASGANSSEAGMDITIQGGTLQKTDSGHVTFNSLNSFSMTSGVFSGAVSSSKVLSFIEGSFNLSGGAFSWNGDVAFRGNTTGALGMSGGTMTVTSEIYLQRTMSFDLSGGHLTTGLLHFWQNTPTFTFTSGSDGILTINNAVDFNVAGAFDFEDATVTGSIDITNPAFDPASYETWYTEGKLLFGGSNAAAFSEVFEVTGSTLTVIPEPGTLGLLGGFPALILFVRRRLMM